MQKMPSDIQEKSQNHSKNNVSRVPFIDFSTQYQSMRAEIQSAVNSVFESQQFVLKEHVPQLEKAIASQLGTKHAVGVASGSDALYLSLWALGIGEGDEVITTPFTFFATAGSISRTGAKPVFADIDPKTFNLDPAKVREKITKRTKAIIPVHLFGQSCDMDEFMKIGREHSLAILEDAAQSYGATWSGKQTGSFGSAGGLSFFPTKNLGGAGDGGMIVTSSDELAEKLRILRVHGSKKKYYHDFIGINSRLDELQAAVVSVKLKYIDDWNKKRQEHAKFYDKSFAGLPLATPYSPAKASPTYHLYSILTDRRDELAAHLEKNGIGCGVYYPLPLHLQPCYQFLGHKQGDFPVTEKTTKTVISLPMFPELTAKELERVVSVVREFYR